MESSNDQRPAERRRYTSPTIVDYGPVASLTQGSPPDGNDVDNGFLDE